MKIMYFVFKIGKELRVWKPTKMRFRLVEIQRQSGLRRTTFENMLLRPIHGHRHEYQREPGHMDG